MSEMIKRVAAAIQLRGMDRGYHVPAGVLHHLAAAAIEAMREPTEDMTKDPVDGHPYPVRVETWQEMIDAALK